MNNQNQIYTKKPFDLSDELVIQRYRGGVRLVKASNDTDTSNTLASFNSMQASVFFVDTESTILHISPGGAELNGLVNSSDMNGKTVYHYVKKDFADLVTEHDKTIIKTEQPRVTEDVGVRKDEGIVHCVTMRFPWYHENKLIGVYGIGTTVSTNRFGDLVRIMNKLISCGLISGGNYSQESNSNMHLNGKSYYSKRELEIIDLMIKGMSTKEIANAMFISKRTVEHHIENIKLKANCRTRYELIYKITNRNSSMQ